jgi:hypothetical protein
MVMRTPFAMGVAMGQFFLCGISNLSDFNGKM